MTTSDVYVIGPDDLVTLRREAGVPAPVPPVDFARDVVVGFATEDGPCSAETVRAVTDGRTVRLRGLVPSNRVYRTASRKTAKYVL